MVLTYGDRVPVTLTEVTRENAVDEIVPNSCQLCNSHSVLNGRFQNQRVPRRNLFSKSKKYEIKENHDTNFFEF